MPALGAVGVNKTCTPNSVTAGQVSTLTIVLLNPNASIATGVDGTDNLPTNVVVANPLTVGTITCGFTVAATPGTGDPAPGNPSATDSDPIVAAAVDLAIVKQNLGAFSAGQVGAQYAITVSNVGSVPSSGLVTVTDVLPAGLTATAIGGMGWTCTQPAGPCTRSDPLAPGASYPELTLTVNVAANPPSTLLNVANVAGGGDVNGANNAAQNVVNIGTQPPAPPESIPAGSPATLALLALLLAFLGGRQVAARRRD